MITQWISTDISRHFPFVSSGVGKSSLPVIFTVYFSSEDVWTEGHLLLGSLGLLGYVPFTLITLLSTYRNVYSSSWLTVDDKWNTIEKGNRRYRGGRTRSGKLGPTEKGYVQRRGGGREDGQVTGILSGFRMESGRSPA